MAGVLMMHRPWPRPPAICTPRLSGATALALPSGCDSQTADHYAVPHVCVLTRAV